MPDHSRNGEPRSAAGTAYRWETYLASAIGADHVRAGTLNEDAVAARRFDVPDIGSLLVFAVADGHGHARHFRSDRGSRLAVAAAVSTARQWASALPAGEAGSRKAAGQLVSDVVSQWRQAVAADLVKDPVTDAQAAALHPDDPAEIPYGTTLLLAVVLADVAVLAQIGDGEIVLVLPDGRHLEPVPGDSRLDGTQTTSLCQPDAVSAFRVALVNLAKTPVFAVFAATDGYGNAQADENWRQVLAADLVRLGAEHGTGWLGEQLDGWAALCASSEGSGDDSTVALALNSAAALRRSAGDGRRPFSSDDDGETLPYAPVQGFGQTLVMPDQPGSDERRPGKAAGPQPALTKEAKRWLAGAVLVVVAVALYLILRSSGPPSVHPAFTPGSSPTSSHSARPKSSTNAHHKASPTSSSKTSSKASNKPNPQVSPTASAVTLFSEKWSQQ